ncbi:MAG: PPE family protein [Mycobacterium sp.]
MDYATLPPEINSARMYTGPGSGSLSTAAASWDSLAAELSTTAETYESVISSLSTLQWRGPAAAAMTATVAPYVGWLYTTAEQTQQTAMQARAAAMAFEQAYAMTVPPPLIAANRAQLTALIATNFFGQNTAAIAATEELYAEMWAQDATAMYGYASSSVAATTTLTPFAPPQQTTNPAGLTAQSAAVAQANSAAAATDPLSQLVALLTQIANSLFPGTGQFELLPQGFSTVDAALLSYSSINGVEGVEQFVVNIPSAEQALQALDTAPAAAAAAAGPAPLASNIAPFIAGASQVGAAVSSPGLGSGAVLANVAKANTIGPLSVPASWTVPSTGRVAALAPAGLSTFGTQEAVGSGMPGVPGMPMGALPRGSGMLPRYGVRLTVMSHPPMGG